MTRFRVSTSIELAFLALALSLAPITSFHGQSAARADSAKTAIDALNQLPVKGRAPKTGYSREAFGQAWSDVDRNGCDTRNDILKRDLKNVVFKPGTRNCVVISGQLQDPYSGTLMDFIRGETTSAQIGRAHV